MLTRISFMLDAIADRLEAQGLIKQAYEIDKIADHLGAYEIDKIVDVLKKKELPIQVKISWTLKFIETIANLASIPHAKPVYDYNNGSHVISYPVENHTRNHELSNKLEKAIEKYNLNFSDVWTVDGPNPKDPSRDISYVEIRF